MERQNSFLAGIFVLIENSRVLAEKLRAVRVQLGSQIQDKNIRISDLFNIQ